MGPEGSKELEHQEELFEIIEVKLVDGVVQAKKVPEFDSQFVAVDF
jgi:hypothetical protein